MEASEGVATGAEGVEAAAREEGGGTAGGSVTGVSGEGGVTSSKPGEVLKCSGGVGEGDVGAVDMSSSSSRSSSDASP